MDFKEVLQDYESWKAHFHPVYSFQPKHYWHLILDGSFTVGTFLSIQEVW
jgi:hypothetical protein